MHPQVDLGASNAIGDALTLVAAVFFALCSVLLKRMSPDPDAEFDFNFFFGCIGYQPVPSLLIKYQSLLNNQR